MGAVVLKGISKRFGAVAALEEIDLEIADGELAVILGPSGCGKSTLLRAIAGLEAVSSGEIEIAGNRVTDVPPAGRRIAMVFQSYALYPHMTAYQNMAFGLKLRKAGREEIDKRVQEAAALLQIAHLLERKPKELSGGQRQRVAMGRALVRDPEVFLFDEPLSNLDAALRVSLRIEIARLQREIGATMVYVTHDQTEAMTLAQKLVVMREGRIEQIGAPLDVYNRPSNRFVATFVGSPAMNLVPAKVIAAEPRSVTVALEDEARVVLPLQPDGVQVGSALSLGVRPEDLSLGEAGDATLSGEVLHAEQLGAESYVYVHLPGGNRLVVWIPRGTAARTGEPVTIGFRAEACHLFRESGEALPRADR